MRIWLGVCCALLLTLPAYADYDDAGNIIIIGGSETPADDPGDICGMCPDPAPESSRGVTYKNGELWVLQAPTLYHLSNCMVIETVTLQGGDLEFGLGYDSTRDLWITTTPGFDVVSTWTAAGALVASWPSPGGSDRGPVGVAYDATRDLYWMSDWRLDMIVSTHPDGTPGPSWPALDGRVAGTAYDPATDTLYYHGRDNAMGYCVSASTGTLIVSFPVPLAGPNNGQGAGFAPDGNVWIAHLEEPSIFCLEKNGGATPVEPSTWGAVKAIF